MAKATKAKTSEKSDAQKELEHWQDYCTRQGYDLSADHPYKSTIEALEKAVQDEQDKPDL
jgi:polysaccharide deacetylase 2 family uncharacterized protein YibQ